MQVGEESKKHYLIEVVKNLASPNVSKALSIAEQIRLNLVMCSLWLFSLTNHVEEIPQLQEGNISRPGVSH